MTIKQIQHLLAFLGYYTMLVDGIWGEGSEQACKEFQADYNKRSDEDIFVDGIAGKQTENALTVAVANRWLKPTEDKPVAPPMDDVEDDEDAAFWATVRHFTKSEFTCKCGCGLNNINHRLVLICDDIRERVGVPFDISSGCRCKKKNDSLPGAAPNSRHLYGRAVDFRLRGKTAAQTLAIVKADKRVAYCYAIDNEYVHMDIV